MAEGNFFIDFIVPIVIRYQQQAGGLLIWAVAQAKKKERTWHWMLGMVLVLRGS